MSSLLERLSAIGRAPPPERLPRAELPPVWPPPAEPEPPEAVARRERADDDARRLLRTREVG